MAEASEGDESPVTERDAHDPVDEPAHAHDGTGEHRHAEAGPHDTGAHAPVVHADDQQEAPRVPAAVPAAMPSREALDPVVLEGHDTALAEKPEAQRVAVIQFPEAPDDPARPRRRGWWQRRGLGE